MTTITLPRRLTSIHAALIANVGKGLAPSDAGTSAGASWARSRRYNRLAELESMGLAITRQSGPRGGTRYHAPATADEIKRSAMTATHLQPDSDAAALVDIIVEMSKAPALSAHERLDVIESVAGRQVEIAQAVAVGTTLVETGRVSSAESLSWKAIARDAAEETGLSMDRVILLAVERGARVALAAV
jgi:hypothetical protein